MAPKRFFAFGAFGVALAALLFIAQPILAQRGGGGGGRSGGGGGSRGPGGGGGSRSFSGGSGSRSFAGSSGSRGFSPGTGRPVNGYGRYPGYYYPRYFRGYYPGFFGYGAFFGYPGYFGLYGLNDPWYYPGYSSAYSEGLYAPDFYSAPPFDAVPYLSNQSGYSPGPARDDMVHMRVIVPAADAQLWVENQQTIQSGTERDFDSPSLTPGKSFMYEMRAQWTENGREVVQTRKITVRAGERLLVDFTQPPPPEKLAMPRVPD